MEIREANQLGAHYNGDGRCSFCVWAPLASAVDVRLTGGAGRSVPMNQVRSGYFTVDAEGVVPGDRYFFRLDGGHDRPDPASRFQPLGVHGPSEVVDPTFDWTDRNWQGLEITDYVIYELHVGTFSAPGTFEAVIPFLDELKSLGITAIELMPVAQFPGDRNWGYDGVNLFAVQNSYGGPESLRALVDACHRRGLAVVLDVVYNHLGPEGNYLAQFGPYFTERYRTPWGPAVNFDGPDNDEVRRFFIENVRYWIEDFHIDALRLDAVHAILDHSAVPFLQELGARARSLSQALDRRVYVIAESALNDSRIVRPVEQGGFALDAQWDDDFHHSLRTLLTGDRAGYYEDFGDLDHLVKAYREGYVYSGQYSAYRRRRHGNSSRRLPARQFVVFSQNHDQVGNRMRGERLGGSAGFEGLKLAAGAVILSPFIPLLFMGEEYGETAPFQYFVSHSDAGLIEAVRRGRREEFAAFGWEGEPPDPQAEETFRLCKLNRDLRHRGEHKALWEFYREALLLRRTHPVLSLLSKDHLEVGAEAGTKLLYLRRWCPDREVFLFLHLKDAAEEAGMPLPAGRWMTVLDSSDGRWFGPGSSVPPRLDSEGGIRLRVAPFQFAVLSRE
ncbi:MAG: malto-oligosyltrehalose trehalohydrolase [Acidobacteriota bacterium]